MIEIDQQHFARLQPPLYDDVFFRHAQHADFRRHDNTVVAGDDVTRGPQAVAIERGADLPPVGEGDGGGAVPWLHQRGVIFVKRATLLVHERVARPCLGDHHHHRVGERIAAHGEKFERVIETRGVGLTLVGDRPEFRDVVTEFRRRHRRLTRRHPVVVAAQRVDLAVMRDHAIRVRQRPGRERVGGETLMDQRQRALEFRIAQVGIIGAELVGEKHALVDHGAAGDRHRVVVRSVARPPAVHDAGDGLAHDVEPALEFVFACDLRAARDEDLPVHRLGRLHRFAERRIVGRHVAPAEDRHAIRRGDRRIGVHDFLPPCRVVRQEQHADAVVSGRWQREAEFLGFPGEKLVRGLNQNTGAVAGARVGADRAAMFEVEQDRQRVFDDPMRLAPLDIGNESDTAGIFFQRRIKQAET